MCLGSLAVTGCATTTPVAAERAAAPAPGEASAALDVDLGLAGEIVYVPVDRSPCLGPADARVTLIEFTDFECGHCARAQETLHTLRQRYPDDLRVCFKHRTIPLHFYSRDAAEAAEAARLQGAFWQMHDLLFEQQEDLRPDRLVAFAQQLNLDVDRFNADRMSPAAFEPVDRDEALAAELGVRSTPTFYINGRLLQGAKPLADFEAAVSQALADADTALRKGVPRTQVYQAIIQQARKPAAEEEPLWHVPGGIPVAATDPCRGAAGAPLTLVEFTDFECPFCGMAKQTLDRLEGRFGDQLRLCVKMTPLSMHPHARQVALYALAAHRQGKFFAMYDDLFANQEALDSISVRLRARDLGLDVDRLERDARDPEILAQLQRHEAEARQARISGTPGFVVNELAFFGALPYEPFEQLLLQQLQERETEVRP